MSNRIDSTGFAGCFRCFHVWKPRRPDAARCPRCKSTLWDVPKLARIRHGTGLGIEDVLGPKRSEIMIAIAKNKAGHPRVFGSVARSAATERSDVDLLVEFESGASLFDQVALITDLERILRRKVEVSTPEGLHWIVRPQVLFEAVPL